MEALKELIQTHIDYDTRWIERFNRDLDNDGYYNDDGDLCYVDGHEDNLIERGKYESSRTKYQQILAILGKVEVASWTN